MEAIASDPLTATLTATPAAGRRQTGAAPSVTRYLVAAAFRDKLFRDAVLSLRRYDERRAHALEPGLDVAAVERSCRQSWLRDRFRDAALTAILLLTCVLLVLQIGSDEDPLLVVVAAALCCILVVVAERVSSERRALAAARAPNAGSTEEAGFGPQNVVVYGSFVPFVGFGLAIGGWSFAVDLNRASNDPGALGEVEPFEPDDLSAFICGRVDEIGIPSLHHGTMLFVDGRSMRDQSVVSCKEGRPVQTVSASTIASFDDTHWSKAVRRYLRISVIDWDGEIILSIFLRFKKFRTSFFVESDYYLLPPLKTSFYEVDCESDRLTGAGFARMLCRAVAQAPVLALLSPFQTLGALLSPILRGAERRHTERAARDDPKFNYGAETSIRELASQDGYRVYIQKLDQAMNLKVIEQQVIDAIVEFLNAKGVDVSDIRDRRSTILNNGVIVSGGSVIADSMAVGVNATAQTNTPSHTASPRGWRTT